MIKQETLKDFFEYLNYINLNYENLTIKTNLSKEENIMANLACLTEEVWEVSTEISQKKIDSFKKEDLEDEIIDVLITNLLLAKACWIENLDKAVSRKIKKNNDRWY